MSEARDTIAKMLWEFHDREFHHELEPSDFNEEADEVVAALQAKGLQIVPREPTQAMHEAGIEAILRLGKNHAPTLYKAMLSAAQE